MSDIKARNGMVNDTIYADNDIVIPASQLSYDSEVPYITEREVSPHNDL